MPREQFPPAAKSQLRQKEVPIHKLLIALAFLSVPVAAAPWLLAPTYAAQATELGDLSPLRAIAADTLDMVAKGDMTAATARITDFESAWDAEAAKLRALNAEKWGVIDGAADAAIASLRAPAPVLDAATSAVTALIAALDNPSAVAVQVVGPATAVTDANGRPLPCEDLLADVRTTTAAATVSDADKPRLDELTNKGIERCNADDDKRADDFFAQALAILGK